MTQRAPGTAVDGSAKKRSRLKKSATLLGLSAVVLAAMIALRELLGVEFNPEALRDVVNELGVWAPLGMVAVTTFRLPLGLPSHCRSCFT